MPRPKIFWIQLLVHILALTPLALLVWDFTQGQLTANPIREIQFRTGKTTLNLLVLTLACTPVYAVSGFGQVLVVRRLLGFYTAGYASLHFMNFIGLDYGFNLVLLWEDIHNKRFVLAGFAAFLILLVLAVTSTAGWKERLSDNWKRLHRLVYLAALLAVLHFIWQTKADFRQPFLYGVVVALLLITRIPRIQKAMTIRGKGQKREQGSGPSLDEI